jgi:type IV secretory pathway component VirB8
MKRYRKLIKDTWWLWLIFTAIVVFMVVWVSPIFLALVPMLITVFFYFAFVRYDEDGNFL